MLLNSSNPLSTQRRIEGIRSILPLRIRHGLFPLLTSRHRLRTRIAVIVQLLTDKSAYDPDVERTPMLEINNAIWCERRFLTPIEAVCELYGGIGAAAEIKSGFSSATTKLLFFTGFHLGVAR